MRKCIFIFLLAPVFALTAFAQNKVNSNEGTISGNILNEKNQALSFATVLLLKAGDSTLVKSSVSNDKGGFIFEELPAGRYLISVSSVGYQKYFTTEFIISSENQSLLLNPISLTLTDKSLQAVTVSAKKQLIEMQADKLVMNAQNSIVATGNTALEVLQKAPGVVVDQADNISLNGKTGILIYMDGKQTYMSQSDLTNLLKNMRSDQIDKIEIISNPSAKYDAAGKAIINIITIKNKNFGTNGSISAGGGMGFGPTVPMSETKGILNYKNLEDLPRYNTSLNLNNRKGKVNLFGNLNFNTFNGVSNSQGSRIVSGTVYDQYVYTRLMTRNLNYKAGLDYFVNKKTTLGVLINGNKGHFENPVPTSTNGYVKTLQGVLQSNLSTSSNVYYGWTNTTFNGNFKHVFDSTGRELSADIDIHFIIIMAKNVA